jgi:P27 family predicted phage terminase small subunit
MPAGRPRKPTHLKLVKGTQKPSRVNHREPKPDPGAPRMPAHLRPYAREKWRELVPMLLKMGVISKADGGALTQLCQAYADLREAQDSYAKPITILRRRGERLDIETGEMVPVFEEDIVAQPNQPTYVTEGKGGAMIRPRPEVRMIAAAEKRVSDHYTRFGLDPSSRGKVQALGAPAASTDPASKYFS